MNKWTDGQNTITATEKPVGDWYPVINLKRVSRSNYTPYTKGSAAWVEAANRALKSAARCNFERR